MEDVALLYLYSFVSTFHS